MGWWSIAGTQNVIGDGPLDRLSEAVRGVITEYEDAFQRRPTCAEWEALLLAVLGAEEPEARVLDDGVVKTVRLEAGP